MYAFHSYIGESLMYIYSIEIQRKTPGIFVMRHFLFGVVIREFLRILWSLGAIEALKLTMKTISSTHSWSIGNFKCIYSTKTNFKVRNR